MKTVNLTEQELTALKNILNICIDQYETSGGDIDYTALGDESVIVLQTMIDKLNG